MDDPAAVLDDETGPYYRDGYRLTLARDPIQGRAAGGGVMGPYMRSGASGPAVYLIVLAAQVPAWLVAGLMWSGFMVVTAGWHPTNAVIGGLGWALFMWLVVGNLLAAGLVWRRSVEFSARDRAAFRSAVGRASSQARVGRVRPK